jgi:hypothetical protein
MPWACLEALRNLRGLSCWFDRDVVFWRYISNACRYPGEAQQIEAKKVLVFDHTVNEIVKNPIENDPANATLDAGAVKRAYEATEGA